PNSVNRPARIPLACHSLSTRTPSLSKITSSKRRMRKLGHGNTARRLARWHRGCSDRCWRCAMIHVLAAALMLLVSATEARAQAIPDRPAAGVNRETGAPGSAGPKDSGVVQRGAQPNPGEVRRGSPDGDTPSASAGTLREEQTRRIFGLPVTTALIIGAAIVAIFALAGLAMSPTGRRSR